MFPVEISLGCSFKGTRVFLLSSNPLSGLIYFQDSGFCLCGWVESGVPVIMVSVNCTVSRIVRMEDHNTW